MSELSPMERRVLRNWLWQLAYHELDDASVTVGVGSSSLIRPLRRLAMHAVAPEDGIACTRCGNGPAAPCCRKGCIHGDDCIHCVARKEMTRAAQLSYAKELLKKAINEPGAIGSSDGVNYALLEEITDFLNLPKGVTKVGQVDTSDDELVAGSWADTGDGGLCTGNRDGEATRFVYVREGTVQITDGDGFAAAPVEVVRALLPQDENDSASARLWRERFDDIVTENGDLRLQVNRLTERLIEAQALAADLRKKGGR